MRKFADRNLWAVAFIVDFMSPQAPKVMSEHFPQSKKIVVYPLRASVPNRGASACTAVLEKFMTPEDLPDWSSELEPAPQADLPIAAALKKIQFDIQFNLHTIDQVVIVADSIPAKDGCGQDVCQAIRNLEPYLRKSGRRLRVQTLAPLECRLPPGSLLSLKDSSQMPLAQVVRDSMTPLPPATQVAAKTPALKTVETAEPSVLEIQGPPIRLSIKSGDRTIEVKVPATIFLNPGSYQVALLSPSWLKDSPGFVMSVPKSGKKTVSLQRELENQVQWIPGISDGDQVVVFDSGAKRILIPAGSPPVPLPKDKAWKVIRVSSSR